MRAFSLFGGRGAAFPIYHGATKLADFSEPAHVVGLELRERGRAARVREVHPDGADRELSELVLEQAMDRVRVPTLNEAREAA